MIISLRYGTNAALQLEMPPSVLIANFTGPNKSERDVAAATKAAWEAPLNFPPLRQAIVPGDRVVLALGPAVAQAAEVIAAIVAGYLQQRLDLAVAEPTPREIAALFEQRGFSSALTAQAVHLFEACDSARFLPAAEVQETNLTDAAEAFILAVEEEMCPVASS